MFLVAVINHLKKNISNKSTIELVDAIKYIVKKCPDWLYEVKNNSGKILRMNKHIKLEQILKNFK